MQRKITLFIIALIFGGIVFSSYEHGPAYEGGLNRTGSQGGIANCAGSGCHGANSPTTIVAMKVVNDAGTTVTQYAPGTTYTVTMTGNNTTTESLEKFGFQVSAVLASSAQAGSFAAISSATNVRIVPIGSMQIAEHKKPLSEISHNNYQVSFKWTAPVAGSGNVTFYGILNPVADDDGDKPGHKTTDDDEDDDDDDEPGPSYPNIAPQLVLTEGTGGHTNGVAGTGNAQAAISCYPNPFSNALHITLNQSSRSGDEISIYDLSGKKVMVATTDNTGELTLNTQPLAAGRYILKAGSDANATVLPIVKQ